MSAFLFLSLFSFAPMDSVGLKKENGKTFIIHQIDKGQTLSAIARKYGVPSSIIIETNKIEADKIQAGQKLLIPMEKTSAASNSNLQKPDPKPVVNSTPNQPKESATTSKPTPKPKPTTSPKLDVKLKPTTKKVLVGLGRNDVLDAISFTALHPNLPAQSLVKVVNSENGRIVFVRVVGKTTGEMGIYDLVISQAAMDQLRVMGDKVQADITFGIAE